MPDEPIQQELNIAEGVSEIAESLGLGAADDSNEERGEPPLEETAPGDEPAGEEAPAVEGEEAAPVVEERKAAPSSWPKDKQALWDSIPKEAQDQIHLRETQRLDGERQYKEHYDTGKRMNDIIAPYRPMIQAQGLDDAKAVAAMLNAQYRLTNGSPQQRMAVYQRLGQDLGLIPTQQQPNLPPEMQQIVQRQQQLEAALIQRQQAEFNNLREQTTRGVEEFAKSAPYFDEVATEIVAFINAGNDLQSSYEKAVWANPATRAKEQARVQKEAQAKLREQSSAEVAAAKRATAANVRGRDTGRTPTEPKGKFLDDRSLSKIYDDIQAQTH